MEAVIYTRHSPRPAKQGENGRECESCKTQEEFCKKWCLLHESPVVGVYTDEGRSGKCREGREGLRLALDHVKRIKGALVAYSLSRWARSTVDAITIAEELEKVGCQLVSIKENLDTSTPAGKLTYTILAAFAAFERQVTAERTRDAMRRYQASGRRMGSRCPIGYIRDPDDPALMIPNLDEQRAIERALQLNREGAGLREIARVLDSEEFPSRTKSGWNHMTIGRLLKREHRKW